MNEKLEVIKEYLKYFPDDHLAKANLIRYEVAEEFGFNLEGLEWYQIPKIEGEHYVVNNQISIGKKYYLVNSKTHYEHNGEDWTVEWKTDCGRLDFVDNRYWWDIEEEWNDFTNVLKSYNPLDYDEMNNVYVYNVENGKRLINDYDTIKEQFTDKLSQKIKKGELQKKQEQLEKLKAELEG